MKSIEDLIEASSLGTPEAKALRASVPDEVAQQTVRRSVAFGRFERFGFTEEQAWALARADMDLYFIPASAVGL